EDDGFELVISLVDGLSRLTIEQVLELHLDHGSVAAGLVEFSLLDDPGLAIDHGHLAGTKLLSGFHSNIRNRKWTKNRPRIIAIPYKIAPVSRPDRSERPFRGPCGQPSCSPPAAPHAAF